MVEEFLDSHLAWIIDGNYTKLSYERRLEEADQIWILLFNRFTRFARVCRRYRRYRGQTRPDMAEGCTERLDRDFADWVLRRGCIQEKKRNMRDVVRRYPQKSHLLSKRHIPHFIKKQRSTGSQFELAWFASFRCTRERAFCISEKL